MDYSHRLIKDEWQVKPIYLGSARRLVEGYHYAGGASKTAVYLHGLFQKPYANVFGVAWWLPPTKVAAQHSFPEGDWRKVLSLSRLVVHPDCPKNAASFLLSQSRKLIDKTKWHCLVTYADTWKGHTGGIYRADNWEYMGLTKPSPVFVDANGIMMGKKRASRNLTTLEMNEMGFTLVGRFAKHKFRKIL